VLLYMAFIFYLSSMPEPPLPSAVNDKEAHFSGYALLGLLTARAAAGGFGRRVTRTIALAAIAIAIAYGISDEFHQSFVPGRDADLHDVYADGIGAVMGTVACWAWGIIWPRLRDV
jgi:VanZ family protein